MKIKEFEKVFVEVLDTNIVLVTIKSGYTMEAEDIRKVKAYNIALMGNKEYGLVVDAEYYTSVSSEARKIMTTESIEKNRKAMSIVIYEFSQRILGNVYIRFNNPSVPTRLFSSKENAINWVKKQLNQ